jgi:hypothetical protein
LYPADMLGLLPGTTRTEEQILFYPSPFRRRVWQVGPLLESKTATGQVESRRAGLWRTFYRNGMLMFLQDYETHRSTYFRPDGTLVADTYNEKEQYPGDSVQRETVVLFAHGTRADTLHVKHTEYRNNRFLRTFFSKDFAGKQRITSPDSIKESHPKQMK